jgi:hypothetical protein
LKHLRDETLEMNRSATGVSFKKGLLLLLVLLQKNSSQEISHEHQENQ